jgi:DNA (cytosine-5)-methyltransferase 1
VKTLLDLYCKAGGAGRGYQLAGFKVTGVDLEPQPNYIGDFIQWDAIQFVLKHGHEYDAIHASPPCQLYSPLRTGLWKKRKHPDLISPTREALKQVGRPYVIENVEAARRWMVSPTLLCGSMFSGLEIDGHQLRRHRYFECSFKIDSPTSCQHNDKQTIGVYGHPGGSSVRDGKRFFTADQWRQVMQISWMTVDELAQAVPPAYTHWIGVQLRRELGR